MTVSHPIRKSLAATTKESSLRCARICLGATVVLPAILYGCSHTCPQRHNYGCDYGYDYGSSIEKNFAQQVIDPQPEPDRPEADEMPAGLLAKIYEERYVKSMTEPLDEQPSGAANRNNLR